MGRASPASRAPAACAGSVPHGWRPGYGRRVANEFELLRGRLRRFADARDWAKFHSPRNLALALTGEVGELAAELQWVPDGEVAHHLTDQAARARLADEVADVLIYLVRFADVCGIDPLSEAYAKIDRNEVRYPPTVPPGGGPSPGEGGGRL
jgi:NTP pyrophosphatase (non-canonical NTP hydrolase)